VRKADSVHLRRTVENAGAIEALSRKHRAVGIEGVLAHLERQARGAAAPGSLVSRAFAWEDRDNDDERWWPQGISWSTDVPAASGGLIATSAYAKGRRGGSGLSAGSRITFVDRASLRYQHVLLVSPHRTLRDVRFGPLRVHAGGLVWAGPYLHVAGTRRGILTCRTADILEVSPSPATFGHRFVLPVRFAYEAAAGNLRYSFLSLDRGVDPPELIAGEYGRGAMTTRLVRYRLAGDHLATDATGISAPSRFDAGGAPNMQGAVTVGGTWYVSRSRGQNLGELLVGRPGAFRTYRDALPVGPEDLTYWPEHDELLSQSEYPGQRYVFTIDRFSI
jgi:hypothetical protein